MPVDTLQLRFRRLGSLRLHEPVSALTHFLGALLSVAGLVLLVRTAVARGTPWHVASFTVFGTSLILLYAASAVYHWLPVPERIHRILRRVDHTMIFVLIAGTYTPFCLVPLRGAWGWSIFGVVWTIAAAGIVLSILWIDAPRWLYVGLYVFMGCLVVVAVAPLIRSVPLGGLTWLGVGGLFYLLGAALYASRWPNPFPRAFGFHEIWHLFVMAGSFSHFWAVLRYLS